MADEDGLRAAISEKGSLVIAFSGGLDSTVLAKLAVEELKDSVYAATIESETLSQSELNSCKELAHEIGIELTLIKHSDLKDEDFVKNPKNRCFYCRSNLAKQLRSFAEKKEIQTIADGANLDDLDDYRPGLKAFNNAGIWHPFIEFEFTKADIRALGEKLNLSVKNKPSNACLASRIEYYEEITDEKLRRIEEAEDFIRSLSFYQVRVRYLKGDTARIEVLKSELDRLLDTSVREKIVSKLKALGFKFVSVDLEGYRTGSLNVSLAKQKD